MTNLVAVITMLALALLLYRTVVTVGDVEYLRLLVPTLPIRQTFPSVAISREKKLLIYFILFLISLGIGIWMCSFFGISPVAGGLLLLTIVIAIMIGENLPERLHHIKFWYYMMLIAIGMILFGLIKSGLIPITALSLVAGVYSSLTSLAIIETCIILIIASIAFYIFVKFWSKIKPKTKTGRVRKSTITYM